jgi:hypothetical protein
MVVERTGAHFVREKQVPRCARNDRQTERQAQRQETIRRFFASLWMTVKIKMATAKERAAAGASVMALLGHSL